MSERTQAAMIEAQNMLNEIGKELDISIVIGPKDGMVDVQYRVENDCRTIYAISPLLALHEICHYLTSNDYQRDCDDYDLGDSWFEKLTDEEVAEGQPVYNEELDEYEGYDLIPLADMFDSVGLAANNKWMAKDAGMNVYPNDYSIRKSHVRELLAVLLERNVFRLAGDPVEHNCPTFISKDAVEMVYGNASLVPSLEDVLSEVEKTQDCILRKLAEVLHYLCNNNIDDPYEPEADDA